MQLYQQFCSLNTGTCRDSVCLDFNIEKAWTGDFPVCYWNPFTVRGLLLFVVNTKSTSILWYRSFKSVFFFKGLHLWRSICTLSAVTNVTKESVGRMEMDCRMERLAKEPMHTPRISQKYIGEDLGLKRRCNRDKLLPQLKCTMWAKERSGLIIRFQYSLGLVHVKCEASSAPSFSPGYLCLSLIESSDSSTPGLSLLNEIL